MGKAARKLSGAALAEFRAKHPHGPDGRFVKKGAATAAPSAPSAPTPGRARAKLGLAASKADMPSAMKALRDKRAKPVAGDREAVDAILAPMSHAQLDEVAREFDAVAVKGSKQEKRDALVKQLVGGRLDTASIMSVSLAPRSAATRQEAEAFFARQAERLRGTGRPTAPAAAETEIRKAVASLSRHKYPGYWVPLADLREALSGLSREEQDAALLAMATKPGVHVIPWDNTQALRQRDHDASLRFGGDDNHAIRIEAAPESPLGTARPSGGADKVEWTAANGVTRQGQVVERKRMSARVRWDDTGEVEIVPIDDPDLKFSSGGKPTQAKGRARTALAAAAPSQGKASAASVRDALRAATSTEDAQKRLADLKLSAAELKRIAGELDVPTSGGAKAIRDALVKIFATGRITTAAVSTRNEPGPARRAGDLLRAGRGPKA